MTEYAARIGGNNSKTLMDELVSSGVLKSTDTQEAAITINTKNIKINTRKEKKLLIIRADDIFWTLMLRQPDC